MIFVFMMLYYRVSGFIATVSLILNLLFSFTILIAFGATLTLPGIAGLALVIGMGVDSNVLIFERMRDELVEGAAPRTAVDRGFKRAFTAIFDANITHGIIGVILYNFGTGPLKGFAVTLLIGIVTTLFCAVTVCRVMFDHYLAKNPTTLSV
jgi:protein-export membrane protein SecD